MAQQVFGLPITLELGRTGTGNWRSAAKEQIKCERGEQGMGAKGIVEKGEGGGALQGTMPVAKGRV